jgi:folate-binding protein YgfZ
VVRVSGPDAQSFLQGQCSQDVVALSIGESGWSLLLQPQGKVDALLRITCRGDQEFVLDVDGGFGPAVVSRLQRFKLRVKADIEPLEWRCLAVRGPASATVARAGGELMLDAGWPGLPGVDLLGPEPAVPDGLALGGDEVFELVRIEAGTPRMGAELTERTIPAEAGIVERTVSFTKGCFTGQELVARIDSRGGHVPRRLRGVVVSGDAEAADRLLVDGQEAGTLTSVARAPAGTVSALAYVRRDVASPADAVVDREGRPGATILDLPLVS